VEFRKVLAYARNRLRCQKLVKVDHREICCEDGSGSGLCLMVVVLAALKPKVLLAEILMARRELGTNREKVSHTVSTCKLCPWALENTMLASKR
jgi:hypothetical protein